MGELLVAVAAAAAGAMAGVAARLLLARLRRGTRVRAPVCEVAVAALWSLTAAAWAGGMLPGRWVPVLLGLGWLGVAASVVDLRHHRLPDALTLPALPAALALLLPLGPGPLWGAVIGGVVAVAAHAVVHLVAPRAMGGGDVKLAAPVGAVLGAASGPAVLLAMVLAVLLSSMVAVAGVAAGRLARGSPVPHGPSLLAAGWLVAGWMAASGAAVAGGG